MSDTDQEATLTRIAAAIIDSGQTPWQAEAACGSSPELMDATRPPEVFQALALCAGCPVVDQCRSWADSEPAYIGVAGGKVYSKVRRKSTNRATAQVQVG